MKINIPVTYEMAGVVTIEADSVKEAMKKFRLNSDNFKLPNDSYYVDGSFEMTSDDEEFIELFNKQN
jgi:hypothetical protein